MPIRVPVRPGLLPRHRVVPEPRQRVVLREEPDDGAVAEAALGDEGCPEARRTRLHREPGGLELAHVRFRGANLFEAELGVLPDLGGEPLDDREGHLERREDVSPLDRGHAESLFRGPRGPR